MVKPPKISYCSRCVYPAVSATPLTFDEQGVCSGCRTYDEQLTINWTKREEMFQALLSKYRSTSGNNYDCVIAVSGGKDSFYQAHLLSSVYKLKVLYVCYRENNHTEIGMRNIQRMKECFKGDFLEFTPEVEVLKKLNRLGMLKMGDPNWHTHIGIMTLPIQMAVRFNVPLFIYGEHGFMNLGGMHSYHDLVEFTKKYRTEHMCRGFDWFDFIDDPAPNDLKEQDFLWAKYPSDYQLENTQGIFISNYFGWNQQKQTELVKDLYGFEEDPNPRARSFSRNSNLNDIHDDGIHDYMKYVKFGYGRATDHACREIRQGLLSRDQGIEYVRAYDHVVPSDIPRWLEYVGWSRVKLEFEMDKWRDKRVWVQNEYGAWLKGNIWDAEV